MKRRFRWEASGVTSLLGRRTPLLGECRREFGSSRSFGGRPGPPNPIFIVRAIVRHGLRLHARLLGMWCLQWVGGLFVGNHIYEDLLEGGSESPRTGGGSNESPVSGRGSFINMPI